MSYFSSEGVCLSKVSLLVLKMKDKVFALGGLIYLCRKR